MEDLKVALIVITLDEIDGIWYLENKQKALKRYNVFKDVV